MDELEVNFCPFFDQQEKYCNNFKITVEDLTGGFCICKGDCNSCKKKTWNDNLGIPVDKDYVIKKMIKENMHLFKKIEHSSKCHKIHEYV